MFTIHSPDCCHVSETSLLSAGNGQEKKELFIDPNAHAKASELLALTALRIGHESGHCIPTRRTEKMRPL
jgi:hypothetical protein